MNDTRIELDKRYFLFQTGLRYMEPIIVVAESEAEAQRQVKNIMLTDVDDALLREAKCIGWVVMHSGKINDISVSIFSETNI